MWIFEGILYVILLLVFIRYDRKKRHWIKTVSQEEKFEHYLSELSAAYPFDTKMPICAYG